MDFNASLHDSLNGTFNTEDWTYNCNWQTQDRQTTGCNS